MNEKKIAFDVYLLDVYLDEGGWIENERHLLGNMEVEPAIGKEIDAVDVLSALKKFRYRDYTGRQISALVTTDRRTVYAEDYYRRTVYAEDYYGDGSWWEVGAVKNHVPVYGLKLKGDAA